MTKIKLIVYLVFFLSIAVFQQAFANTPKEITLRDGSVIRGELLSFQNGIYTIQTQNLGRLQIPETNVINIGVAGAPHQNHNGDNNDHNGQIGRASCRERVYVLV